MARLDHPTRRSSPCATGDYIAVIVIILAVVRLEILLAASVPRPAGKFVIGHQPRPRKEDKLGGSPVDRCVGVVLVVNS